MPIHSSINVRKQPVQKPRRKH